MQTILKVKKKEKHTNIEFICNLTTKLNKSNQAKYFAHNTGKPLCPHLYM